MKLNLIIITTLLSLFFVPLNAQWQVEKSIDDFTDEVSYTPYTYAKGTDYPYTKPLIVLLDRDEPGVYDLAIGSAGYWIDDDITVKVRVDDNDVLVFPVLGGSGSESLYIRNLTENSELIKQMKKGNKMVLLPSEDYQKITVNLSGFTNSFNKLKNNK